MAAKKNASVNGKVETGTLTQKDVRQEIIDGLREPPVLKLIPGNIPAEMRKLKRFVGWNWLKKDGKRTKPPCYVNKNGNVQKDGWKKPENWMTYEAAVAAYKASKIKGIGILRATWATAGG
jgi:hypothetical protein